MPLARTIRSTTATLALGAALAAGAAGCGGDDDSGDRAAAPPPATAKPAAEMADKPPRQITCGDIADPVVSGRMSRRATNVLASEANVEGLTQLQAAQSIFFAMTELCKKNDAGYRPADDAVKAVKAGEYRADLGSP